MTRLGRRPECFKLGELAELGNAVRGVLGLEPLYGNMLSRENARGIRAEIERFGATFPEHVYAEPRRKRI